MMITNTSATMSYLRLASLVSKTKNNLDFRESFWNSAFFYFYTVGCRQLGLAIPLVLGLRKGPSTLRRRVGPVSI